MKTSQMTLGFPGLEDDIGYVTTVNGVKVNRRGKPKSLPVSDATKTLIDAQAETVRVAFAAVNTALGQKVTSAQVRSIVLALFTEFNITVGSGGGGGGTTNPPTTDPTDITAFNVSAPYVTYTVGTTNAILVTVDKPSDSVNATITPSDAYAVWNGDKSAIQIGGLSQAPVGTYTYKIRYTDKSDSSKFTEKSFTVYVEAVGDTTFKAYDYRNYVRATVPSNSGDVLYVPSVMDNSATNAVHGFNFNTVRPVGQMYNRFATVLQRGKLMPTDKLEYVVEGSNVGVPVQFKPLQLWDDGSIAHVRCWCLHPALNANQTIRALLRKSSRTVGSVLDHSGLASVPVAGSWNVTKTYTGSQSKQANGPVDVNWNHPFSGALIAAATADSWEVQGDIAAERRYYIDMPMALRMYFDVTKYADGTWMIAPTFCADKVPWSNPGGVRSWLGTINITQGGTSVFSATDLRIGVGQLFQRRIHTGRSAALNLPWNPPEHNIQQDAAWLVQSGKFPFYDVVRGVSAAGLANVRGNISDNSLQYPPLLGNYVTRDIGAAGARLDIGWLTGHQAFWMLTQESGARDMALVLGDSAGVVPWNHYDTAKGVTLNVFANVGHPKFWQDDRVSGQELQANMWFADKWHDWTLDYAHQPYLPYVAYMITGDRFYLERVEVQGCNAWNAMYPPGREQGGIADHTLMQNGQTREAGWCTRDGGMTLLALPDGHILKSPMRTALDNNFKVMAVRLPEYKRLAGEPHGYLMGAGDGKTEIRTWENDHVAAGVMSCYLAGVPGALNYLKWAYNFFVSRFFQDQTVLPYRKATWYNYEMDGNIGNPSQRPPAVNTWKRFGEIAGTGGSTPDASGWLNSGVTHCLAMRSCSIYAMIFNDANAYQSIIMHERDGAPYVTDADLRRDPTDSIRPLKWASGKTAPSPAWSGSSGTTPTTPTNPTEPTEPTNPPVTGAQAFNTTGTEYLGVFSPTKKLVSGYSGPWATIKKPNGDTQDINFTSNGKPDYAAIVSFAAGGPTYIQSFKNQIADGQDLYPVGDFGFQITNNSGVLINTMGELAVRTMEDGNSRAMKIGYFNPDSASMGVAVAVRSNSDRPQGRIVAFRDGSAGEDANNPRCWNLISNDGTEVNRTKPDGSGTVTSHAGSRAGMPDKAFMAVAYRSGASTLVFHDNTFVEVNSTTWGNESSMGMGDIIIGDGYPSYYSADADLGDIIIYKGTLKADIELMRTDMTSRYSL